MNSVPLERKWKFYSLCNILIMKTVLIISLTIVSVKLILILLILIVDFIS